MGKRALPSAEKEEEMLADDAPRLSNPRNGGERFLKYVRIHRLANSVG